MEGVKENNSRIGHYVEHRTFDETVRAYVPVRLPPVPGIDLAGLAPLMEKATQALGELKGMIPPSVPLFVQPYLRKEALLSSQIEGTQSSYSDLLLFENDQSPQVSEEDVEEVSHYIQAIQYGLQRLREGFPLSLRLLKEIHGVLLKGGRGEKKLPGEFRNSQNWIGGTRPGNALFVPPPVDEMKACLYDLENFFHDESIKLPVLIKAGMAHVQFETIHPFLDGNGRIGRLLITLILCESGMLSEPTLYLSLYLKRNRMLYYNLLQEVRMYGRWETWLEFFLQGVYETATQAIETTHSLNNLFERDRLAIESLGRARLTCLDVFRHLQMLPQVSVKSVSEALGITLPTARSALQALQQLGIVSTRKGEGKEQLYLYTQYLGELELGCEV